MKDYSSIEQKLSALMEELKVLKEADDEEEVTAKEETAEETVSPDDEATDDVSVEETTAEEETVEEEPAPEGESAYLIETASRGLLQNLMGNLDDVNMIIDNGGENKYSEVFGEVRDHLNSMIGALQAVLADESEDAQAQDEARAEAEEVINGEATAEETAEEETAEQKIEVIEPIEGEEEPEEVNDEEVEEVEEEEEEEVKEESLNITTDKKPLDEDLQIYVGFRDYEPWSGAKDTYNYIMGEYGWDYDAVERVLEDVFPDGCSDTELNDFFWFGDEGGEIYDIFGVRNPYAEDEEDDEDEEEYEEDDDIEIEESASDRQRHRK